VPNRHCRTALGFIALTGLLAPLGAEGADLSNARRREGVVQRGFAADPVALVQRVEVVAVTPYDRYVVYEDAPAYLYPVFGPRPRVLARVPRYFPRGVVYNRPSQLPPLRRCLC
jgi:hypothetical protein